jgi:glycopeptide antibiotics resistance protein
MTLRPTIVDPQVESAILRLVRKLRAVPGMGWVTDSGVEFTANVAMFVPLGLLVIAWRGRWWHGILGGLVLSAGIETWQLLMLPGRVADVRDLLANALGAALGVGAAVWFSRWLARSQEAHTSRHRKVIDSPAQ